MTNSLVKFEFEKTEVRVVTINGMPCFIANDVCKILDIKNSRDAIEKLDDDEKGVALTDTPGGPQEMIAINESGLYTLILRSRKAAARRFRKWVTAEVLPSIRKTGGYSVGPPNNCLLQEAVAKASAHEAACCRIALNQLARQRGITDPEEFATLARESLSNGDANPNPKLWEVAPPHPETVKRVMRKMVETLATKPMLNA